MKDDSIYIYVLILVLTILFGGIFTSYYEYQRINLTIGIFVENYWDVPTSDAYAIFDAAIEEFESEHYNVSVSYYSGFQQDEYEEYIAELALLGELPDVFMIMKEDFPTYAQLGLLEDLTSYVSEYNIVLDEAYYQTAYESGIYKDTLYALPFESVPTLMVVNKTLLEENGYEIPDENWTWDEFYELCEALTIDSDGDGIIDQYGSYNYTWEDAAYTNGVTLFNDDGTLNIDTEELEESIKFAKSILDLTYTLDVTSQDFDEGYVVFQPMLYAEYSAYTPYPYRVEKSSNFEMEIIPLPTQDGEMGSYQVDTLLIGMSSTSKNADYAFEFLQLLCNNDEIQSMIYTESRGVSPKISVTGSDDFLDLIWNDGTGILLEENIIHDVMLNGATQYKATNYEDIISYLETELYLIMYSTSSMSLDLDLLEQKVESYINE